MYLLYLIYTISSSAAVLCDVQRQEEGGYLADFIIVNKGKMQYPSILMFLETLTVSECADMCIRHLRCVTINYNWNTRACELVDQNFDEFEAVGGELNWYNYGTPEKIDGGWTKWTSSHCSVTCGYGSTIQYRTCTAPEPKYGGLPCVGDEVQTVSCKPGPCPIDGGLSDWKNVSKCTVTCGGGTLEQMKTCTKPAPQHGGKNCTEEPRQKIRCNNQNCPCKRTISGTCCKSSYRFHGKWYHNECVYNLAMGGLVCIGDNGAILRCGPTCKRNLSRTCCKSSYKLFWKWYQSECVYNLTMGRTVYVDTSDAIRTCGPSYYKFSAQTNL